MGGRKHDLINYNQRYKQGYMTDFTDLYEACRVRTVTQMLVTEHLFSLSPSVVLDIACGQGRYIPLSKKVFPVCRIIGIDISTVAVEFAQKRFPGELFLAGSCESIPLSDGSVDTIFSIETLEHVASIRRTVEEWARVLKPGGKILLTTPCANKYSLEWFIMRFTGGLQHTEDGIGRFRTDEPGHLRRLNSQHLQLFFSEAGLRVICSRFRTHFFTTIAYRYLRRRRLRRVAVEIAMLDWRLFRRLPNGASMLVIGEKPDDGST
jgi:ubiquinone/menaquinone biosynthesis C-methylase UbiE